ncbi:MAG TPA: response regulator [Pyrinomonadaceae bacterium]|jgi:CheY-like chemotaxis protein
MTDFSHAYNVGSSCTALARSYAFDHLLVLIVEDHEDTRFLLRTLLERRGMRVCEAEDGVAGVRAAEELRPDLILMDWSLPRMDGLSATRFVRACPQLSHTVIVILSGHAAPESQKVARDAGCCEYLVKPFELDQLDRVLSKHLSLRLLGRQARCPSVPERDVL